MNIKELHKDVSYVSLVGFFKGEAATVTAIRIAEKKTLNKHTTPIPALLVCISGEVVYEEENGHKETLKPGDYVNIRENVLHWLEAAVDSDLLLMR